MKTRAAVAVEKGKPLEIMEVDLEGPKAGEVLVEIKATGICHTDEFTLSGADPEGLFPAILGHEGAGIVVDVGPGVTSVKKGDHVIPLYTPECRQCPSCLSRKTNLCTAIRATQGQGVMPDGTLALLARRQEALPLHGHLDLRQLHGAAGDRGRQDPRGRALRQGLLHRLRRDDRHRRRPQHGQGGARRQGHRVRPRRHRPQRHPGPQARRRRHDHRRRHQQRQEGLGRALRHDPLRQPQGGRRRPRRPPRQHDQEGRRPDRRRRLHLRLHGQRHGDAPGAGGLPPRLGRQRHHRRAPAPARRSPRGPSSWSRAASGRARPSAARAAARMCPRSSTGTWRRRSRSTR